MKGMISAGILFWLIICSFPEIRAQQTESDFRRVEDVEYLLKRLNGKALKTESIQSNFTQDKHLSVLEEVISSKGSFWFKKENKLKWAYETPFEYAVILSEGKFTIVDGSSVSAFDVESNEAFKRINDLIIDLVRGRISSSEQFRIRAMENPDFYRIRMIPADSQMKDVISEMQIFFSKTDLSVARIIMNEGPADYTVITFSDSRFNESIPDSVFTAQR